jgi:glutamyl-tRNA synthetase
VEALWAEEGSGLDAKRALLSAFRKPLAGQSPFDAASLEALLRSFLAERGLALKDMIHVLRIGLTGKRVGLGLFETMEILGRERCLGRIDFLLGLAIADPGNAVSQPTEQVP